MKPVNKKAVKDYYEKIKQPMDLETMTNKVKSRKYHSSHEFMVSWRGAAIFTTSKNTAAGFLAKSVKNREYDSR